MGNFLTPITKKISRALRKNTTKGKVDQLEDLTKSLTTNTELVATKYKELDVIVGKSDMALANMQKETFEDEIQELRSLDKLTEDEQESFVNALSVIKEKAIQELAPIGKQAQVIKAHMLVTLNKAMAQKVVLITKTQLASNANLQLDTLKIIQKETKYINKDLSDLIAQLDDLNQEAINKNSEFRKDVSDMVGSDTKKGNAAEKIINKVVELEKNMEKANV